MKHENLKLVEPLHINIRMRKNKVFLLQLQKLICCTALPSLSAVQTDILPRRNSVIYSLLHYQNSSSKFKEEYYKDKQKFHIT